MKNKKKMGKMIALALVLGSCSANVTEAVDIYGNSSSPTFEVKPEGEVVSASNNNFAFNYDTINFNNVNNVFAGYASNADSVSNTLNFTAGAANNVYAGYVNGRGNATNNTLNFTHGTVRSLYGGYVSIDANGTVSGIGNANGNKVEISGGSIANYICGGSTSKGDANNNTVSINGGNSYFGATGGQSSKGNANNNTINIGVAMSHGTVIGGSAQDGNSDNNTVNITSGADNIDTVIAGHSVRRNTLASYNEYSSNANKVFIDTDGSLMYVTGGKVVNTYNAFKTSANNNEVTINNSNSSSNIFLTVTASSTEIDSSKATDDSYIDASNNKVTLNGGKALVVSVVHIEDDNTTGNSSVTSNTPVKISGNNLTIKGGEVGNAVAIADDKVVASAVNVKDNSIDIKGGVVQTNVYGGHFVIDNLSTIEAANNTVNWYDGDVNGSINGYTYVDMSNFSRYGTLSDSTFNFFASRSNYNKTISNLDGFQNYHFYLGPTIQAGDTLINITGYADLRDSNVGVAISANNQLEQGDSVILLSAASAGSDGGILTSETNLPNRTSRMISQNIYNVYDFTLRNEEGRRLIATLGNTTRNPKAENLMGIRSAEAFMTYDKVDVVDKAYQASKHTSEPTTFIEYSYSDVTAKDDTKMRGSNVLWGIASTIGGEKDQANTLTRGIFFEYGDGTFSSIGHYPTGSIYGYGKSKKLGMGVLVRKVMFDRHYYDAYLRAGTIKTDYDAFADGLGNIKYENRDMYVSGNLGYGQFIQLTPNLQMDTYIKYFYNRIPGHSTTAYTNGVEAMPISFDVFENHRFRLGSKFTWDYMESNNYKWYADVALEQEFARDQSGSINSHRISKSNGSSTTGVIELCYENKFGVNDAFMFTAKAQGYVGDRRGLGASANLSFSF